MSTKQFVCGGENGTFGLLAHPPPVRGLPYQGETRRYVSLISSTGEPYREIGEELGFKVEGLLGSVVVLDG